MPSDMTDPKTIGIIAAFWILCTIVTWKGPFGAWADWKLKIMISVVMLPIIAGIIYSMGSD